MGKNESNFFVLVPEAEEIALMDRQPLCNASQPIMIPQHDYKASLLTLDSNLCTIILFI